MNTAQVEISPVRQVDTLVTVGISNFVITALKADDPVQFRPLSLMKPGDPPLFLFEPTIRESRTDVTLFGAS